MHGEQLLTVTNQVSNAPVNMDPIHEGDSGMQSLLHDTFPMHDIRVDEGGSQMGVEDDNVAEEHDEECTEEAKKFFDLLKESNEPLWSGCTAHSIFSAIVGIFNLKCESGWSNTSFLKLLGFPKGIVPKDAKLPQDTY